LQDNRRIVFGDLPSVNKSDAPRSRSAGLWTGAGSPKTFALAPTHRVACEGDPESAKNGVEEARERAAHRKKIRGSNLFGDDRAKRLT
jgi:hypothetical protein